MTNKADKRDRWKIKDIIQKLQSLECPLIGNEEDAWVEEILFKPNVDKYCVMEWILSKFEYSYISKKLDFSISKGSGFQNSSEAKSKNLLETLSSLGLCNKDTSDIIEGVAPFKDQLNFWKKLVDILWKKCSSYNLSEDGFSSCSKDSWTDMDEHETHNTYVRKIFETVNISHLFNNKMDLFPPLLLQEFREETSLPPKSKIKSLKELKTLAVKNSNNDGFKERFKSNVYEDGEANVACNNEESLDKLEEDISSSLRELQLHANNGFNATYENIKLYLNVPLDESNDVGPSFQAATVDISRFLELKNALSTLKSSESELKSLNTDLQSFEIPNQSFSDSMLREYIAVLNDTNKNPT